MQNPVILKTMQAHKIFGKLIRIWSLLPDEQFSKEVGQVSGRFLLIDVKNFHAILAGEKLIDQVDYEIRDGIEHIELIKRTPNRAGFLLPEPEVLSKVQTNLKPGDVVCVPAVYGYDAATQDYEADQQAETACPPTHRPVVVGKNPLETFLDPYLSSYMVTQCQ